MSSSGHASCVRARDRVLARPLVADAREVLARLVVEQDVVDEATVVGELLPGRGERHVLGTVERAEVDVDLEPRGTHGRAQVVPDERAQLLGAPHARRELLVGEDLVLHVDLVHAHPAGRVLLDEPHEVARVRVEVLARHDDRPVVVRGRGLHPRGRAPRRAVQHHLRLVRLGLADERQDVLLVAVDGEVLQREVPGRLVVAVPGGREVVRPDRRAVDPQVELVGAEELAVDLPLLLLRQRRDRAVPELVEGAAEAADRPPSGPGEGEGPVGGRSGVGHAGVLPAGVLGRARPGRHGGAPFVVVVRARGRDGPRAGQRTLLMRVMKKAPSSAATIETGKTSE